MKIPAAELKPGDVIMPPARELRLWMRRSLKEKDLPESALHITLTEVYRGSPDKRGEWLRLRGTGGLLGQWNIAARPATRWAVVSRAP